MADQPYADQRLPASHLGWLLGVMLVLIPWPISAGELERGKKIARLHCARCHVAGDFNPMGGISSTPSFFLLVREFDDWRQRFGTFYLRRPHGAFITLKGGTRLRSDLPANAHPIELSTQDVRDVTAYAATLKNK